MGDTSKATASKVSKETLLNTEPIIRGKHIFFVVIRAPFIFIGFTAHRAASLKGATFARQPCCRIPCFSGFRPVALRPTLSSGLPLSSFLIVNDNLLSLSYSKLYANRIVSMLFSNIPELL
jgi:hypothetical protein